MLSNIQFHIRQEMEFVKPIVEERSARMEEFGDDWDKPVREPSWLVALCLPTGIIEWHAHVVDERG